MDETKQEQDWAEQAVRFLLLLSLWTLWLLLRAVWSILVELSGAPARRQVRRVAFWGLLVGFLLLAPHAVGLWWSRMMLLDAAEIAALQAEGRDPADLESDLRRRAFKLGFRDILAQPSAVQVQLEVREAGPVCKVVLDFRHQLKIYGWTAPPLRIQASVERFIVPRKEGEGGFRELINSP